MKFIYASRRGVWGKWLTWRESAFTIRIAARLLLPPDGIPAQIPAPACEIQIRLKEAIR